jgi:demethylmenaquinone methyltransferase/2-methoxy-6-polyprenyl-1,4-benzoquinol methylase
MAEKKALDKSSVAIRGMFAEVAPRYDLLNRLLSCSLDVVWRRRCAESLSNCQAGPALDLCCGTGDQAKALQEGSERTVIASDFCLPMLDLAERKFRRLDKRPLRLAGDALSLPFRSGAFAAVTVSFGLRNFADLDIGLEEIHRVLESGGQARFLEFTLPRSPWLRVPYDFYLDRILPLLGGLVSANPSAYRYLPDSVAEFPQRSELVARMTAAGFHDAAWEDLSGGTVCLYKGVAK